MAGYTDARMKEYKRQGMGAETIRGEEAQHRVVNALAGHDNFNDAAGSSYARNLRMENEQLGPGHQQTGGLLPKMFDAERDGPQASGPQGNIAASVYDRPVGQKFLNSDYLAAEAAGVAERKSQQFPMMSMRRITKLPYIEDGRQGMLQGGLGGHKDKKSAKAAAVYVPPDAGFGVGRSVLNKESDIENSEEYYGNLREHMRAVGPEGVAPIHVQPRGNLDAYGGGTSRLEHANLGNGGHRVAIAMELGWTHMRTTSDKGASGYAEESEYGKGMEDNDDYDGSDGYYREDQSSYQAPSVSPRDFRGPRAQPPGGTGGPREWARDDPQLLANDKKARAWGTGPIEAANARMRPGADRPFSPVEMPGQQAMQVSRPVPSPYGSQPISGEQFK